MARSHSTITSRSGLVRTALLALAALGGVVAAGISPAAAATTDTDPNGTFVVDGSKAFVFGLSNPPARLAASPSGGGALAEVTAGGVTMFRVIPLHSGWGTGMGLTSQDIAYVRLWNQSAAQHHAMTWVALRKLGRAAPGTIEAKALHDVVVSLSNDVGFGMWKGFDEPNLHRVSAGALQYAHSTIRSLDVGHVAVTIQAPISSAAQLRPYGAVTDVHGVDVFPVRYGIVSPDLHSVGRWTATLRSVTPTRAVVTTLQICAGTSDDPGGSGRFVTPSRLQERYMAYDAIINGARGLVFYGAHNPHCWRSQDRALGWNWTFWSQVVKPLLAEIGPGGPVYPALLAVGTGLGMTTSDPTTQILSRVVGDEIWVIAARWGSGSRLVAMRGLPKGIVGGHRIDGTRITVRNGGFTDNFRHNRVHVYRFTRP